MNRRIFLKTGFKYALAAGIPTLMYANQIEPYWVEWTQNSMDFQNLDSFWIGKRVVQISDLHIGARFNPNYQIQEFQKISALKPDLVVYTGDFISVDDRNLEALWKISAFFPR
ncbi:MAG: hypothetical protein C4K58_07335 [Flavobacteriaceae bacterium]|nr:MAG: hypothetical protein C4K58_07335 [Flavobacteriaceae bacterium]